MQNKNLKFSGIKETDNFETVEGMDEILRDWLEGLTEPFEPQSKSIDAFEFKRRDGFIPHRHNCGGLDLLVISHVAGLMGSGSHFGLKIEQWVEDSWDNARAELKRQAEERGETVDTDSDSFFDDVYQYCSNDYETIGWRVRCMYEGNGVLMVYVGYDKDAPYFRWNDVAEFKAKITFKTLSGLKRQLDRLSKKVVESQNEPKKLKNRPKVF